MRKALAQSNCHTLVEFFTVLIYFVRVISSFRPHSTSTVPGRPSSLTTTQTFAHPPARLAGNSDGVLYVNDKCINCAACNIFAPGVFDRSEIHQEKHVVFKQPDLDDADELDMARASLAACPVGAIRVENSAALRHRGEASLNEKEEDLAKKLALNPKVNSLPLPFPRPLPSTEAGGNGDRYVWYVGYHNDKSFGAVPFVAKSPSDGTTVMIDTPRFGPAAVRAVQSLCGPDGPDYLLLTHVDDTADHLKWRECFPNLKRIFHEGDLGRNNWLNDHTLEEVEVLLHGASDSLAQSHDASRLKAWTLDGSDYSLVDSDKNEEFVILHTPGHSDGSICLMFRPSEADGKCTFFTGDTLAYSTRDDGGLSGFPRYGNNLVQQADTLLTFLDLPRLGFDWDLIAPGHGRYQSYDGCFERRDSDVRKAAEGLLHYAGVRV